MPANQQPTYTAYTVSKREGKDDFWTPIGAAFMHQDGDGFNVILTALPIDGKIVLRVPKTQSESTEVQQQTVRAENDRRKSRRERTGAS